MLNTKCVVPSLTNIYVFYSIFFSGSTEGAQALLTQKVWIFLQVECLVNFDRNAYNSIVPNFNVIFID